MGSMFVYDLVCPIPNFQKSQEESFQWLSQAYQYYQTGPERSEEHYQKLLKKVGVPASQIGQRNYFLSDFHSEFPECRIFSENQKGISERQAFFQEVAEKSFREIYETRKIPKHLIHVTCTGYQSPSAAQILAAEKSPETMVTHAYHMGCYGAFPALRMGSGFLQSSQLLSSTEVDVVHTELCTLHLNPEEPSLEKILVQTLFADGVAVYRLGMQKPSIGFELLELSEFLIPNSKNAMSWGISETGFEMTLSKDVPGLIRQHLRDSLEKWEKQSSVFKRSDLKNTIVAVHPGGPKIIDFVKEELELRDEQVSFSRKVLFNHGNMSSATVPHIWKEILEDSNVKDGSFVLSMAFGPGLTLCLSLMKVVK